MSGLRRTRAADLAVPFAVVAIVVYAVLRAKYGSLPPLRPLTAAPLAALAAAEAVAARRVRAAVRHDPDAKPMAALVIARCVALGKASSLVAAGVAGAAVRCCCVCCPTSARCAPPTRRRRGGRPRARCSTAAGRRGVVAGTLRCRSGKRRRVPTGRAAEILFGMTIGGRVGV